MECNQSVPVCSTPPEKVMYGYFIPVICTTGVLLNIINISVFTRRTFTGSTFTFLAGLGVVDLLTLLLVAPIGAVRCDISPHPGENYLKRVYDTYVFLPVANSFATSSVWTTLAISVERLIILKYPTIANKVCSPCKARMCVITITICSFFMNFPYFFVRRIDNNFELKYTKFGTSYGFTVYSWIRTCFVKLIPIFTIAILNGILIHFVRKSRRNSGNNGTKFPSKSVRMQNRTTAMLITIALILILCHVIDPLSQSGIYRSIFGRCSTNTNHYNFVRALSNCLETFSYATNFFIYYTFHQQFRITLLSFIRCRQRNNSVRPMEVTNQSQERSLQVGN